LIMRDLIIVLMVVLDCFVPRFFFFACGKNDVVHEVLDCFVPRNDGSNFPRSDGGQVNDGKQDPDAIIRQTLQIYDEWGGVEAKFSVNIQQNGASQSFEGSITVKNDKFALVTPDMLVWFDGKTQWTYLSRNDEVNISEPNGADLRAINPLFFLRDYNKDFKASYIGESTSANARTAHDLRLTPKKKDDIENIDVQIEKASHLPVRIVAALTNGMRNTVTIREITASKQPDNAFVFPAEKFPNVEIIDLR